MGAEGVTLSSGRFIVIRTEHEMNRNVGESQPLLRFLS
eukprot:COSAG01_NODE_4169_length_5274_cov_8.543575_7_plen_38_part_00